MKLSDFLNSVIDNRGRNPDRYFENEKYPVIDNFLIKNELHPNTLQVTRYIDEESYQNFLRGYVYPNMVIMTLVGNGIGNVTTISDTKNVIIQNTIGFDVKKDLLSDIFLFYFFRYKSDLIKQFDRGSGQPSIKKTDLLSMEVDFPTLKTQEKIASILSSLDNKIELNNAINNNLEQQAQALFKSWSNEIDYDYRALSDVSTIKYGKGLPTNKLLKSGYKVFGGNGIIGSYSQYLYEQPQILISCRGAASGTILESYPYSFVTNNSLIIELNDRRYYEFLKQFLFLNQLHSFVTGSAQPQITIDNIRKVEIPYPRYEKIAKLDNALKSISIKIYKNICENEILAQLRDTLLPKLMSGEIDVSKVNVDNLTSTDKLSFSKY